MGRGRFSLPALCSLLPLMISAALAQSPDQQKPGWLYNQSVWFTGNFPGVSAPLTPDPTQPNADVYLVGAVDPNNPQTIGRSADTPDGLIVVPDHDQTFFNYVPQSQPANCFGHFVVPGVNASAQTVRTRAVPPGSASQGPIVWAIAIGPQWYPLTTSWVLQYGFDQGLLATVSVGYGGSCWVEY